MISTFLLIGALAGAAAAQPPTEAQVRALEAHYTPPAAWAGPLDSYERWYWPDPQDAGAIRGIYLNAEAGAFHRPPGAAFAASVHRLASHQGAPNVQDGGCGVVWVSYRVVEDAFTARRGGR